MTISERIFELLKERGISQKEFSEKTGIAQSTISDWKRKKTNPVSAKILVICEVLGVSADELLSGTDGEKTSGNESEYIVLAKSSLLGKIIIDYQNLDKTRQERILKYLSTLKETNE